MSIRRNKEGSWFYRAYYEGYEAREYLNKKGKVKKNLVYTGTYYRQNISDLKRRIYRIVHTGVMLLCILFYILAGVADTPVNRFKYSVLPQGLLTIALIFYVFAVIHYWLAPKEMTIWHYRSSSKFLIWTVGITAICGGVTFLFDVVYAVFVNVSMNGSGIVNIVGHFLCGLLPAVTLYIEKNTPYETYASEGKNNEKDF